MIRTQKSHWLILMTGVALLALSLLALHESPALAAAPEGRRSPAPAEDPGQEASKLNGLDFTGLSPDQVSMTLEILREHRCNCGCGMDLAQCRIKDSTCSRSLSLARQVIQNVRSGKDREAVEAVLKAALNQAQSPRPPAPTSDRVFDIDTTDAPFKGPKDASVTIVEFSDYQ